MAIDPLMVPYMQKALGGGAITEQELQQIMKGAGSPFSQGIGDAMGRTMGAASPQIGNLGAGASAPIAIPQMMNSSINQPSGRGPNQMLMQALGGGGQATMGPGGNWIPGPQGFPSDSQGGGGGMQERAATALRFMTTGGK